jgi:hypothetical protein
MDMRVRAMAFLLFAACVFGTAQAAPTNAAALRWSDVATALDRTEQAGVAAQDAAGAVTGRTAVLELEFVQEETDAAGQRQNLFRHVEGRRVFLCYIEGSGTGLTPGWTCTFWGRVTSLQLQHKQRRKNLYLVRLQAGGP